MAADPRAYLRDPGVGGRHPACNRDDDRAAKVFHVLAWTDFQPGPSRHFLVAGIVDQAHWLAC